MKRRLCVHCCARVVSRPRGLCWPCFHSPGVRSLYAIATNSRPGHGLGVANEVLPASPTDARPGTPEKVAVMQARAMAGQILSHPDDATFSRPANRRVACG